ncbi:MAG TPA: hypothetical protein VH120_18795 [Gemmataceae bacterium]|nr:hypothetical protein [Gemmataceae bacterium]
MNRSPRRLLAAALGFGLTFSIGVSEARAQIVTGWSFDGVTVSSTAGQAPSVTVGGSGSSINSDLGPVAGTATALHASAATVYSTPVGNGSPKSFSSNNWAIGDYYQFSSNTSNQTGVQALVDATSSATGPSGFKISFSTDGGSTFADLPGGAYTVDPTVSFASGATKTSTPPRFIVDGGGLLDNQPNLVVRVVDTTAPGGSGGTSRVDNFILGQNLATAVPEPGSIALCGMAGLGLLARLRRRVKA